MTTRNPFAFLDNESPERRVLLLLLAILRKQPSGAITLSLDDITSVEDGASFHKFPDDKGTSLVLRFARRGAEAYFLTASAEDPPSSTPRTTRTTRATNLPQSQPSPEPPSPPARHAVHDDIDLAMREEEMQQRAQTAQRDRLNAARAASGVMPWRTRPQ